MPIQPYLPKDDLVKIEFLIDGVADHLHPNFIKGEVVFELNKLPVAKFTFENFNTEGQSVNHLKKGQDIEVQINTNENMQTLFKGFIRSIEKRMSGGAFTTIIECEDIAYELTKSSEIPDFDSHTFKEKLNEFLSRFNVENQMQYQNGSWENEYHLRLAPTTPWNYLAGFLDASGMMVNVRNGAFRTLDILNRTPDEKFTAEIGTNIFSFSCKEDESKKLSKTIIQYWNAGSQRLEMIVAEQEAETNVKIVSLDENRFLTSTITRMANTFLKKSNLAMLQGQIDTYGNLEAKAGDFLTFNNVSNEIDFKKLLISKEFHTIENGSWKTEYSFGLDGAEEILEDAPSTLYSPLKNDQTNSVFGLQIGVVTEIEEDPDNQFRIKVKIPAINEFGEGIWARLSSMFSGNEMGSFFIPNVNDEVIVGYFGGNPDNPVILGSLYSSQNAMPFWIQRENNIRGLVTKEGMKLLFNDKDQSIALSTENGNKLLISDTEKGFILGDQNGNKIVMNANGITLDSSKEIHLKANSDLKMNSISATISAATTLAIKGSIIKLN